MKHPFYISLLLGCLLGIAACTGPVIIEEENVDENENASGGPNEEKDSVAIIHEGTYSSPYSIAEAQTLGHGKGVWVEGYIVGSVKGSMKNGCNFTANASTAANILLADTFLTGSENDYLYCMPVELPNGSTERDELNLYDHPDHYHRKVRIEGDITLYYSVVGIREVNEYIFCNEVENEDDNVGEDNNEGGNDNEGGNNDDDPNKPHDPNATRQDTLSIAEGIELQSDREYHHVYIKGYIIGYTTSNRKIYDSLTDIKEASARSNIVLADNIEESNPDNMIAVELKGGSYIQQTVNLVDNPQNFHKRLTVKGAMKEYRKLHGCIDIPNGLIQENDTIKDYYFLLE